MTNSPFYIIQDFLNPKQCEELLDYYKVTSPNKDSNGYNIKLEKILTPSKGQHLILEKLKEHIPLIEQKYDAIYNGTEQFIITHYPENGNSKWAEPHGCENAKYSKRKWIKVKDVDLAGVLWLKDFNNEIPIDPRYEVYGGKLEFPQYNFSFVPQRGTLMLYPAYPNFITCVSPVLISDLYQIKINISLKDKKGGMWFYEPSKFPVKNNNYIDSWLEEFL